MKQYTPEQAAKLFNVSVDRIKEQYLSNAKILDEMHTKAIKTGKKVNGYTAEQLSVLAAKYYEKAI